MLASQVYPYLGFGADDDMDISKLDSSQIVCLQISFPISVPLLMCQV